MKRSIGFVVFGLIVGVADLSHAQGAIGIGPRVTFQRGDAAVPDSSALRIFGGQLKMRLTPLAAIEVSADYESSLNEGLTERVKSMPIQASLLVFPLQSTVSPYVLGGIGWYRQSITGKAGDTDTIREMGYHAGLGAEVRFGRVAVHGDYRYTHIRFGGDDTAAASASVVPQLSKIQETLKLSHQGSMWNWGATFFF